MLTLRIEPQAAPVPDLHDPPSPKHDVWLDLEGAVCAWSESRDGERWMHVPGVGSYAFAPGRCEISATADPSASRDAVRSAYIRTVLPMAVQFLDHEVLHASAVLASDGVVALCAVSTTGKSTFAAALNGLGFPLWADDALVFEPRRGSVDALALPFEARLLADGGAAPREPPLDRAPLAALCVLERRPPETEAAPVSIARLAPPEAFLALLTHAYCYSLDDIERNRRMTERYLETAQTVAVYRVTFKPDLERLAEMVDELGRELGLKVPTLT